MQFMDEYRAWLDGGGLSQQERQELLDISDDSKEIESRFYDRLSFGTAGLRGVLGMGLNRMNIHVVRHATQAFAEMILEEHASAVTVAICYDCRNYSRDFAEGAASVLAANGIKVMIFDDMRPTPELSFVIRRYGCAAGINITASHNPKEYNGYKVYWSDGAQLPPQQAEIVAAKMAEISIFGGVKTTPYRDAVHSGMIEEIGKRVDDEFLACVMNTACDYDTVRAAADSFTVVYTPFHGAGRDFVPRVLRQLGISRLHCVEEQMVADGDFPTVASPNPENRESFELAERLAHKVNADFILGTDPDSDRVGILTRDRSGGYAHLTGNQTGVLLLDYLFGAWRRAGKLPEKPVVLKTIVTTEMARAVAEMNGARCIDTFTGFKFMAEKKNQLEESGEGKVVFSYEESYGYMLGDFVRDKDAVTASLLLTEMAAFYSSKGMTLLDALDALYEKYGLYMEWTLNLVMPGLDGLLKMKEIMQNLRAGIPAEIGGTAVAAATDYESGIRRVTATGESAVGELVGSNVLKYELADGSTVIVRPSGTEPKIKVYILARGRSREDCLDAIERCTGWANGLS